MVFRVVLPVLWLAMIGGIATNRWRVRRRVGHDPIVLRPLRKTETPAGYLETVILIGLVVITVDIALNAIIPNEMANAVAIPAVRNSIFVRYTGVALIIIGVAIAAVAVRQMDISWRIGIDHQAPGPLVTRGLYGSIRHPIYSGMILGIVGAACVTADLLSIAVAAAGVVGIPVQARLEESFLASRHAQEYPGYLLRTGRFWPRIRR